MAREDRRLRTRSEYLRRSPGPHRLYACIPHLPFACPFLFRSGNLRRVSRSRRACGSRFTIDESPRRERLDHLVYRRRRDAEEPLEIRFGRRPSVNLRAVVNEGEILPLLRGERFCFAGNRVGRFRVFWRQSESHALTDLLAPHRMRWQDNLAQQRRTDPHEWRRRADMTARRPASTIDLAIPPCAGS